MAGLLVSPRASQTLLHAPADERDRPDDRCLAVSLRGAYHKPGAVREEAQVVHVPDLRGSERLNLSRVDAAHVNARAVGVHDAPEVVEQLELLLDAEVLVDQARVREQIHALASGLVRVLGELLDRLPHLDPRLRVEKTAHQPRARNPIDFRPPPRDPDARAARRDALELRLRNESQACF